MKSNNNQSGFTAIELLITLFIAAIFLASGFQLYSVVIKEGGETRAQANANNTLYEHLQRYKNNVTNPCTAQTPENNQAITVPGIADVTISVSITCPYPLEPSISKVSATIFYNNPQKTISDATYATPPTNCPTGFIKVPGSATYGTTDFCVMKYEAKNVGGNAVSQASGTPWVNIAQSDDVNVSAGSVATDPMLTDGVIASANWFGTTGLASATVDLGTVKNIDTIKIWHYYADSRIYNSSKTEVSSNNINWTTIFDSSISGTYTETAAGALRSFKATGVRYIRDWINGSNMNTGSHWVEIQAFSPTGGATAAAAAACDGCHLITSAEWLTIAQNVLSVPTNWSTGIVGNGYIYSGHNDSAPANSLAASTDNDGYYGETNTGGNQRRTLTLTNGEVIWDLAGNVSEWTADQIVGGQPGVAGGGTIWREFTEVTTHGSVMPDPFPVTTGIAGSASWTGTVNGIGKISSNSDDINLSAIYRGGHFTNGSTTAGVLNLVLSHAPDYVHSAIGFRVAR